MQFNQDNGDKLFFIHVYIPFPTIAARKLPNCLQIPGNNNLTRERDTFSEIACVVYRNINSSKQDNVVFMHHLFYVIIRIFTYLYSLFSNYQHYPDIFDKVITCFQLVGYI